MSKYTLRIVSLIYLLIPNLLFYIGWFKFPIAMVMCAGILIAAKWNADSAKVMAEAKIAQNVVLMLALMATVLIAYSGIGGYCYQILDFNAHNSKYYTVFSYDWPVIFRDNGRYACHYFGFYLLPALVSKGLGYVSGFTLFVWATVGLFLGLCWVYLLSGKQLLFVFLFLTLGGIGHLILVLGIQVLSLPYKTPTFFTEIWSLMYQMQWAPNQLLPTIIVTCVLFSDFVIDKMPEKSFLFIVLLFSWAIFPPMILVFIYAAVLIYCYGNSIKLLLAKPVIWHLLLPGICFIPVFLYFLSGSPGVEAGFIWNYEPIREISINYVLGVGIDVSVLIFFIARFGLFRGSMGVLIVSLLAMFLLTSQFRIGLWNDWFLRGSQPPLIFLYLFVFNEASKRKAEDYQWYKLKEMKWLLAFFIMGAVIPIAHLARAARYNLLVNAMFSGHADFVPQPYDKYPDIYELGKVAYEQEGADQFLGEDGSIYDLYLKK